MIQIVLTVDPAAHGLQIQSAMFGPGGENLGPAPDEVVKGSLLAAWETMLAQCIRAQIAAEQRIVPANGIDLSRLPPPRD